MIGSEKKKIVTRDQIIHDLKSIGLEEGDYLRVTCALSEMGWVEGGAKTILDAILEVIGSEGYVLTYSFTPLYPLPLNKKDATRVFDKNTEPTSGIFAKMMMQHPEAIRSTHPSCSCSGIGTALRELLKNHTPTSYAYEPLLALASIDNGKYLKIGANKKLPGMGTGHLGQNILKFNNRVLGTYGVNYRDEDGNIRLYKRNYVGGCSQGYWKLQDLYKEVGAYNEGKVGDADSTLSKVKMTHEIDLEMSRKNPSFLFCDDPFCHSCRVTWDFSPDSPLYFKLKLIAAKLFPRLKQFFR